MNRRHPLAESFHPPLSKGCSLEKSCYRFPPGKPRTQTRGKRCSSGWPGSPNSVTWCNGSRPVRIDKDPTKTDRRLAFDSVHSYQTLLVPSFLALAEQWAELL